MKYTMMNNGLEVNATFDDEGISSIFMPLLQHLTKLQKQKQGRLLVFLAAPPGSGKSTLADFLAYLSRQDDTLTPLQVIGMDGFHHYQDYLLAHETIRDGQTINLVAIKGAPMTFDLEKLKQRLARVSLGETCGWPLYNRAKHNPEEDVIQVTGDIILLEGNYLLLEDEGWKDLRHYADYTIFIESDITLLKNRLVYRKAKGMAVHEAIQFVEKSDLVNANYVLNHSTKADLTLHMMGDGQFSV